MITWIEKEDLNENLSEYIEGILGIEVHPAVLRHLSGDSIGKRIPFPRLEKHKNYLFGITYIPSNTENPSADFDAVIFAANHDSVVARIIEFDDEESTSTLLWDDLKPKLSNINSEDSTADGGEFLLNLFRETTYLLWEDAENIRTFLDEALEEEEGAEKLPIGEIGARYDLLTQKERQVLLRKLNKLSPTMSIISSEMKVGVSLFETTQLKNKSWFNISEKFSFVVVSLISHFVVSIFIFPHKSITPLPTRPREPITIAFLGKSLLFFNSPFIWVSKLSLSRYVVKTFGRLFAF